ncbi:MAG: hypothetical protein CL463_01535 [Acidimicrobiaceae bacterium]|nr:hypothetical protein [Acidimicrobiaceae bacterium]
MDETGRESEEASSEENDITSDSDDALSMYPTIPDGQEGEIDYGDFDSREDTTPTSFQDPYAAEYPALPVEAPTGPDRPIQPRDLPPWYEDEYYDDREWERLPPRFNTALRFAIFASIIIIIGFLTYNFVRGWLDDQLDPPGEPGAELVIEIPQGATTDDIARILAENDVVANSTVFRYYLRFKNASDFQAGEYTFQINSAVWDARESLERGPAEVIEERFFVTIPEGLTLVEMKDVLLQQVPSFDPSELDLAIATSQTPRVFGDDWLGLIREGIYFPETYDIAEAALQDEQSFLNRMVAQFDVVANEVSLAELSPALGLSPYQILIVASLIEEEAQIDPDRGKIARVIYNRLEVGMNLGIDATIVYALEGDRELSQSDLEVDSPYNTRIYAGLPPSPIAAPGKQSLDAALNPESGDWLYYVRTDEFGPGSHTFATTNQEFQQAKLICIERDLGCG